VQHLTQFAGNGSSLEATPCDPSWAYVPVAERGFAHEEIAMFASFFMDAFRSRRTLRELAGLSDRELWDIGLVRDDIDGLVRDTEA
jgi:uncharacterized protein YjiS (DUF1127 family)